jgi:SAM-dependent methyltransferase
MVNDAWEMGTAYERFMGRWSRLAAKQFLEQLALPPNGRWLDVGCGTGVLSIMISETAAPKHVTGIDFSAPFIEQAHRNNPNPILDFKVGSALDLPVMDDSFDTAVSGLALNFFPQPETAVREMKRAVKEGGTIALYVWDYADRMQMLRYFWDAAVSLNPAAAELDEGRRFPICQPQALEQLFTTAGLREVKSWPVETTAVFQDFNDFWQPFLGGAGPTSSYVTSLSTDDQERLARHLRQSLPVQTNGTIPLIHRAWAVSGLR